MVQNLHIRVDADELADLRMVTRAPSAAIARAGLAVLTRMTKKGDLDVLRVLVAEHVQATGPKPRRSA